jgi:cytochrome c-type biogenesis protein CcmF
MFLVNNLLFVLFTFTVLVGTVFPLVVEAARGVQMSVGRPYFDKMAVPIGVALLLLMGVGPALPWGRATGEQLRRALLLPSFAGVIVMVLGLAAGARDPWTLVALLFGGFTGFVTLREMWLPMRQRMADGESFGRALVEGQLGRGRRRFASYVVHAGATIVIIAIGVSSTMRIQKDVLLTKGQTAVVSDYTLKFLGSREVPEPNRTAVVADIEVSRNGKVVAIMAPRMNYYNAQREPIGTPEVRTTFRHDLYLSIMNIDPDAGTVGMHAMIIPGIGWIWMATLLMGVGGLMALGRGARRTEAAAELRAVPAPELAADVTR